MLFIGEIKMNRVKSTINLFMLGLIIITMPLSVAASGRKELESTYQNGKEKIIARLSQLTVIPDSVKKTWIASLNDLLPKIDSLYTNAINEIEQLELKAKSTNRSDSVFATMKISSIVIDAQQKITEMVVRVEQQFESYLGSEAGKKAREELAKEIEEDKKVQEAQRIYQEKMKKEIEGLQEIYGPFNKAIMATQRFAFENYLKPYYDYDVSKVEAVINQWQAVANLAFTVYSKFGPIAVNNPNNLLIAAINYSGNFLLNRINVQLQPFRTKKLDDAYYKALSTIAQQIIGTHNPKDSPFVRDGFDGVINSMIKKYFTDVKQQAVVRKAYLQNKNNITFNLYKTALLTLVKSESDFTEQQRSYALNLYNLLMSELAVVSQDSQRVKGDMQLINSTMGVIFVKSAQALVKTLQSTKDNTQVVKKIIAYYKQAASYFTQAEDGLQAQTYETLSKNLSDALTAFARAQTVQKSGDLNETITLYKQAQALFLQGGDPQDSTKVSIILVDLESSNAVKASGELFKQFEITNKSSIESYLNYCNSFESSMSFDQIEQLLSKFVQLYQSVHDYYNEALITYKEVTANNASLRQSKIVTNLPDAVELLTSLTQAYGLLQKGDGKLKLTTIEFLNEAELPYQSAVQLFKKADLLYSTNQTLKSFVPPFFLNKVTEASFDFEILAQRHSAKFCVVCAGQITDSTTKLAYYTSAYKRNQFLPLDFQKALAAKRKELSQSKDAENYVEKLFAEAQANEKKLLAMIASDWLPKNEKDTYSSIASDQWDQLVQQYLSLYHLGKIEAKSAFINALQEYVENYKKYGPPHSELSLAMIRYQRLMLHLNDNEAEAATNDMHEIMQLLEGSFAYIQGLITAVANQTNLHTTATTDQVQIISWTERADQAIDQQKNIGAAIGISLAPEQRDNALLLGKEVKTETTLYTYVTLKKTIEISDPVARLADLYKKLGDYYFEQKSYKLAFSSYSLGRQSKDFDQKRFALANTLYLGSQYRDLIITKGQISTAGVQVPKSYELEIFGQPVPPEISIQFPNLEFITKDQEKANSFLIDLVTELFLYNKLIDLGIGPWAALSDLFALTSDQLFKNNTFLALTEGKKSAFVTTVAFAAQMKKELIERVKNKVTNFVLKQKSDKQFTLYTYFIPIPRVIDVKNLKDYYATYPSAALYYHSAAKFFQQGPSDEFIPGIQVSLPHGNDKQEYEKMVTAQVKTYLSQGYSYQEELKKLQESVLWKNLINSNKKDMNVSLDPYLELENAVSTIFNEIIDSYMLPLANKLIDSTSPNYKSLHDLIGKTYKDFGDTLANFLIGDPLDSDYVSVLKNMRQNYVVAITTYNFDSSLYQDLAQKYNAAGEILVDQGKHFDSISYFFTAASICKLIVPQTPTVQKTIDYYYLSYLKALITGSTLKMGQFQKAFTGTITLSSVEADETDLLDKITLSNDGIKITISNGLLEETTTFAGLLTKSSQQDILPDEAKAMDDIRNLVLDSLIFYNIVNSYITEGLTSINEPSLLRWLGVDEKAALKVRENGLNFLTTFSEKNGIAFDTLSSINAMMNRTNFPDGKDFVEMITNGFAQFGNKVKSSNDKDSRAAGYSAIGQFALKLYEAFGKVFINIYYGNFSAESLTSLNTALQIRINQILSPSELYIG